MRFASVTGLLLLCSTMSLADITFTLGNHPQPGETNILLNSGQTGNTVTGTPTGFPGVVVNFTSVQTLLEPSNGQARVSASPEGTPLTDLAIALANNLTYQDLIINPFIGGQCPACTGGASTITVTAVDSHGNVEAPFVFTGLNIGNGSNFLTIVASGGESILSTSIDVPGGINDVRQPRISGPFAPIPEPSVGLLLATGMIGIALIQRKRSQPAK